jgi:hypothetical protein
MQLTFDEAEVILDKFWDRRPRPDGSVRVNRYFSSKPGLHPAARKAFHRADEQVRKANRMTQEVAGIRPISNNQRNAIMTLINRSSLSFRGCVVDYFGAGSKQAKRVSFVDDLLHNEAYSLIHGYLLAKASDDNRELMLKALDGTPETKALKKAPAKPKGKGRSKEEGATGRQVRAIRYFLDVTGVPIDVINAEVFGRDSDITAGVMNPEDYFFSEASRVLTDFIMAPRYGGKHIDASSRAKLAKILFPDDEQKQAIIFANGTPTKGGGVVGKSMKKSRKAEETDFIPIF